VNERDFAGLAAGHALNALSEADERAYQEALARNPHWSSHVRDAADAVAAISATVVPVEPPASIRASLLGRITDLPQPSQAEPERTSHDVEDFAAAGPAPVDAVTVSDPGAAVAEEAAGSGWGPRRWFTLAASIVAVLILGFGAATIGEQLTRPASLVALEQVTTAPDAQSASTTMADGGVVTAHWSASTGQSVLVTDGMPALSKEQTYELWFVRDDTPIAAGIFSTDADGRATAILQGQFHSGDIIAVTVEPAGGSPDGTPSSAPVVALATA
jgi:anti-sigma-K factor RskA